ncbi:MAG: hypothetical protein ACOVMP_00535 [Chthoniobacterales bacterium]
MLNLTINMETGQVTLAITSAIKAGGGVPVVVRFSSNPGTAPAIQLAFVQQNADRTILAYLDAFEAENSLTHLGNLDANDTRLMEFLAQKSTASVDIETIVTPAGQARRPFPNIALTVQRPAITGPASSEGGPVYLTLPQSDVRYLRAGIAMPSFLLTSPDDSIWTIAINNDGQLVATKAE